MAVRIPLAAVLLALTACGQAVSEPRPFIPPPEQPATTVIAVDPAPPVPEPDTDAEIVLVYREDGGCEMMGPNCLTYRLWSDGSADVTRTATLADGGPVEATATIPQALADKIADLAAGTDFDALTAGLEEGSCQACVDGIDVSLTIHRGGLEPAVISSVTYAIPWDEPLFATIALAREQMGDVLQVPLISR